MFKQKTYLFFSILLIATLACGQFELGVEEPSSPLPETQVEDNQAQATPNEALLSDPSVSDNQANVNDVSDAPDLNTVEDGNFTLAYIGPDRNIWVLEAGSKTPRQITNDASLSDGTNNLVEYMGLHVSYDGALLAYSEQMGVPGEGGYDMTTVTWVLNLVTGEQTQILEGRTAGMAWKPGTHLLAYGTGVGMDYFMTRGEPDSEHANGINAFDLDSGESTLLVSPERGFTLASPQWSQDGRFLAFAEVVNMEGSGMFAYYDFEGQQYVAWDEAVGNVSWSPDGNLLTYTRLTYTASGDERLYLRPRQSDEQLIGPDYEGIAYATEPVFSPVADQVAYLVFQDGPMTWTATIMLIELGGGEPRVLGQFEDLWELAWTPDGSQIVFDFGPYESRQIMAINIVDGSQTILADGSQPAVSGQ
jgi:Tol biopolymer transport system component